MLRIANPIKKMAALVLLMVLVGCSGEAADIKKVTVDVENHSKADPQKEESEKEDGIDVVMTPGAAYGMNLISEETSPDLWIDPGAPEKLKNEIFTNESIRLTEEEGGADIKIRVGDGENATEWVYVLAAPFPTVVDGISSERLKKTWNGDGGGLFGDTALLLSAPTLAVFSELWGPAGECAVRVIEDDTMLETAWADMPSWALIPFEEINPRWKVLAVDDVSPMNQDFDPKTYALTVPFIVDGTEEQTALVDLPKTNRDPEKFTSLVMTGVTALVRATGAKMEALGVEYPARDIGDWLREADITHISNEVSFVSECPPAKMREDSLMFCSRPEYMELLKFAEVDVIELTGNHLADWRRSAVPESLVLYEEAGMLTYGGGKDIKDAVQPLIVEHNGNRLAFLGCNPAGPEWVWATEELAGAAPCDYDWMKGEIGRLRSEGILPIVTLQFFESYHYTPTPYQQRDFPPLAEAGAVIVSGSQAHYPQGMGFEGDSFIHYGLGNLFFDQMYMGGMGTSEDTLVPGTRKEFIDRHIFYDGRFVGTVLMTAMLEDYSKPRPMTEAERKSLLEAAFKHSTW